MSQHSLYDSLFEFAEHGILLGVKRCLELGADAKASNSYAFRLAAENGHLEVVKFLLPYSDLMADVPLAMSWATRNGYGEVVKIIEDYVKENKL